MDFLSVSCHDSAQVIVVAVTLITVCNATAWGICIKLATSIMSLNTTHPQQLKQLLWSFLQLLLQRQLLLWCACLKGF